MGLPSALGPRPINTTHRPRMPRPLPSATSPPPALARLAALAALAALVAAAQGCPGPGASAGRSGSSNSARPADLKVRPERPVGRHPGPCARTRQGSGAAEVVRYGYSAQGDLVEESWDMGGDGRADYRVRYRRGDWGQALERRRDEGGDDTTYQVTTYTYDSRGREIERLTDEGGARRLLRTTWDDQDRPARIDLFAPDEARTLQRTAIDRAKGRTVHLIDLDGDGDDDEVIEAILDEQGLELSRRHVRADKGEVILVERSTYDARGRRSRLEIDAGGDGTVERDERFVHDDLGNLLTHAVDDNQDRIPDFRYEYDYGCWSR